MLLELALLDDAPFFAPLELLRFKGLCAEEYSVSGCVTELLSSFPQAESSIRATESANRLQEKNFIKESYLVGNVAKTVDGECFNRSHAIF